jgi:hypothetical protein
MKHRVTIALAVAGLLSGCGAGTVTGPSSSPDVNLKQHVDQPANNPMSKGHVDNPGQTPMSMCQPVDNPGQTPMC